MTIEKNTIVYPHTNAVAGPYVPCLEYMPLKIIWVKRPTKMNTVKI
jgi:hypothetical protein